MNNKFIFVTALLFVLMTVSFVKSSCAGEKAFVIPFTMLEPTWSNWKKREISGTLGLYCKKQDNGLTVAGVMPSGLDSISFDGRGQPIPPTKNDSIIFFETTGCKFGWLNNIIIESEGRISFKVVDGTGLVHTSGKGSVTLPDGKKVTLK